MGVGVFAETFSLSGFCARILNLLSESLVTVPLLHDLPTLFSLCH